MTKPLLYGADYSVYVRIARMALEEKGIDYELVPLDIFAADGISNIIRSAASRPSSMTVFVSSRRMRSPAMSMRLSTVRRCSPPMRAAAPGWAR